MTDTETKEKNTEEHSSVPSVSDTKTEVITKPRPLGRMEKYGDYYLIRYMNELSLVTVKLSRGAKGKKLHPHLRGKYTGFATARDAIDKYDHAEGSSKHAPDWEVVYDSNQDGHLDKLLGRDSLEKTREKLLQLVDFE